jgi:flagellar biogenesis protein FliO
MLLEALTNLLFLFGSFIIGFIILIIAVYVWATVKTNKDRKEQNKRYYRGIR